MPHIILEHSNNVKDQIDYKEFFREAIDLMIELEIVPSPDSIKCRFIKSDEFYLADPEHLFVHLQLSLLGGRDREKLQAIGKGLKNLLHQKFVISNQECAAGFAVEVREMDNGLYQK